jgi:two-component system, OmpR family, phosphate regulon sensor histidine kinase PhoR
MFTNLRWQIALPFSTLVVASVLALGALVANRLASTDTRLARDNAISQLALAGELLRPYLEQQDHGLGQQFEVVCDLLGNGSLILLDGELNTLATNDPTQVVDPSVDELLQARRLQTGFAVRPGSADAGGRVMYVAQPIVENEQIVVILYGVFPLLEQQANLRTIWSATFAIAIGAALFAIVIASQVANRTFEPLRSLTETAHEIAEIQPRPQDQQRGDEVSQLVLAFNTMSIQLRSQIEALKSERGKLATVLQQMTDGVVIADGTGRIQLFNQAAESMFNVRESQALGRSLAEILRDYRMVEIWERCLSTGEEQSVYIELRQPNLFLQCIATPLEETMPGNILLLLQDLTRLRRLETVRRDFISNISHELRTPLASLKALTETLQDGALDDPPAARHFISRIETEVDALSHMVSELLELARIESGKVPLQLKSVSPVELLRPAYERLGVQAERGNLTLGMACPEDLPDVLADAPRLQQVVVNLLHNAIKFTPPGGDIELSARAEAGQVVFMVRDTGVGIPADDLPRIFERFYKADRARSGGGTGLGLAIARHLVEAHGGKIWAESVEGRGSTFYFSLMTG